MTTLDGNRVRILIADDDPEVRRALGSLLGDKYECVEACSTEETFARVRNTKFDLILSGMVTEGDADVIARLRTSAPDALLIIMGRDFTRETVAEALTAGAFDYVEKPFDLKYAEKIIDRALNFQSLRKTKHLYEILLKELNEQRTAERDRLIYNDSTTGLPNRMLFEERLNRELITASRDGRELAVMSISVDRFKRFTDILGHTAADKLLPAISTIISACLSPRDTVARIASDEFSVLITQFADAGEIAEKALSICKAFERPINWHHHELYITASMGIATFPQHGSDANTLLKNAGVALHRARAKGGNNYQFYAADMSVTALEDFSLETALRKALNREELMLYYQPQVDLATGSTFGVEALLRWKHPQMGFIPPSEIIPLAEETGLIVPLGKWSLRTACLHHKLWREQGFGHISVSVNLSPRQLQQPDLVQMIADVIAETAMQPHQLQLELTESLIIQDPELAILTLRELKEMGIKISVDDFGSGYSSLSYLKRLPIDVLKIDNSFIRDITKDEKDVAIVKTVIALAHNLNLKVIAEGVETEEQLELLRALGCDGIQGYYFKLVGAEEFLRRLKGG